jgi:hypothetical protein
VREDNIDAILSSLTCCIITTHMTWHDIYRYLLYILIPYINLHWPLLKLQLICLKYRWIVSYRHHNYKWTCNGKIASAIARPIHCDIMKRNFKTEMTYISGVWSTEPKSTYDELLFLIEGQCYICYRGELLSSTDGML